MKQRQVVRVKQMEVVCGVLVSDGKVFIGRRRSRHANGVWEFPGGKVEAGESEADALARELKEELCVEAKVGEKLCTILDEQEGWHLRVHAYLCHSEQQPHDLCAHSEGRWVDPEELTQYAFQPADAPIIQNVLEVVPCLSEPKK